MDTCIIHGKLLLPAGLVEDGALLMRGSKIVSILPDDAGRFPAGAEIYNAAGLYVAPGMIDAHTHGALGYDFMTCTPREMEEVLAWLPSTGVTSFLPTLASCSFDQGLEMVQRLAELQLHPPPGAAILGLHLEGPYLNPERRGAQPLEPLRAPHLDEMHHLLEASHDTIRLVTLAPELPGALDLIAYLVKEGIAVNAGHSDATYEEMLTAMRAGLSRVAHLFNGMSPFNHRLPGVAGAALDQAGLYAEIVLDGIHVHPAAARIALHAKGIDRLMLVTDATQAAGLGDGVYVRPGNRKIIVKDGAARLESGILAGSILTMNSALANACAFLDLTPEQAIRLATCVPAESLNLPAKGSLAPGFDADVILFDKEIQIRAALVGGRMVFQSS
jgi:N-acetylglucosamine-6-phosphate deacetylase